MNCLTDEQPIPNLVFFSFLFLFFFFFLFFSIVFVAYKLGQAGRTSRGFSLSNVETEKESDAC